MENPRDYLTREQQNFLLSLAEEGGRVTGHDVRVFCPENGETHYPEEHEYLDICGNLEHFWVCFGEDAEFYIVVQDGSAMELIADWYVTHEADEIYRYLEKGYGE